MIAFRAHTAFTGAYGSRISHVRASPAAARPQRTGCRRPSPGSLKLLAAGPRAVAGDGLGSSTDAVDLLLDGRIDKCDLVDSFCQAALKQQGRPRENVRSYMEPPNLLNSSNSKAAAAAAPQFPAWCEPMQSVDATEVIDWSDVENDGWGAAAPEQQQQQQRRRSSSSNDSYGSSGCPPAAAVAAGQARSRGALWSGASSSSGGHAVCWGAAVGSRRGAVGVRAVAICAVPSGRQLDTESDEAPHYEGADSDTLFPPGSLELDDPGHPTDAAPGAQGAGGAGDGQGKVLLPEARPYMNIQGGRWVPPSKSQAEQMMQSLSNMGPDEGV